jgi:F0F1-type ATP synthase beta subunit
MFGDRTARPNSGMIVAKIRFDGQLPAIQPVLRTGDDRHITVERPAPRDTLHAHMIASTLTLDLARRLAEEDTVGWLKAPVGRGILWQLFRVFSHVIHRVPKDGDNGRGRRKPVEVQSDARNRRNHLNGAESGAARRGLNHFDENADQYRSPNCRLRAVNPADRIHT